MITKKQLRKLRKKQKKKNLGDEAKPLFISGHFNPDNWMGGDAIIRQFFSPYRENSLWCDSRREELSFKSETYGFDGSVLVNHHMFQNENYVTIILNGYLTNDTGESSSEFNKLNSAFYLYWYKNRGRTDVIAHGERFIDEDEYVILLNAIQALGFNFNLGHRLLGE